VLAWIKELQGEPFHFSDSGLRDRMEIVMEYLQGKKTYEEAQEASKNLRKPRLTTGKLRLEDPQAELSNKVEV
jgi:hypothetical protein